MKNSNIVCTKAIFKEWQIIFITYRRSNNKQLCSVIIRVYCYSWRPCTKLWLWHRFWPQYSTLLIYECLAPGTYSPCFNLHFLQILHLPDRSKKHLASPLVCIRTLTQIFNKSELKWFLCLCCTLLKIFHTAVHQFDGQLWIRSSSMARQDLFPAKYIQNLNEWQI